jgi:hypothetical protein
LRHPLTNPRPRFVPRGEPEERPVNEADRRRRLEAGSDQAAVHALHFFRDLARALVEIED